MSTCICCGQLVDDDLDLVPVAKAPNPSCPLTGVEMSDEEWIERASRRKRAEKIGMPVPQKWMVPQPSMLFQMNAVMKRIWLPAITKRFNESSVLLGLLDRKTT